MEQSVHRPLFKSGLPFARRINSAPGERVGLDPRERGTRRPVVTASYIDPPTPCPPEPPSSPDAYRCELRAGLRPGLAGVPAGTLRGVPPPLKLPPNVSDLSFVICHIIFRT